MSLVPLSLGLTACGDCVGIGISEVRPGVEQSLSVGSSFTASYFEGGDCPRRVRNQVPVFWFTDDSMVVRVDSVSGSVRALAPGDALVYGLAQHQRRPSLDYRGSIRVRVR